MEDLLISTLESLGFPIIRQGSLAEDDEYPQSFLTFWNNSADGQGFYSNTETQTVWSYLLCFYSTNPRLTYSKLLEAKSLLKSVGFTITGKGYDVVSDEITHTGRAIDVFYLETN